MRLEAELAERLDIVADGQALFTGRDQRAVDGLRQPLLGPLLGYRDRLEPCVAGHLPSCS
ncbi:Uncharacterised protein [Mycobacteroides abscessus subsp. massiliense]|nr:Uncharacterised protein [Mycobacteroides abscessus subsp. massiliense]